MAVSAPKDSVGSVLGRIRCDDLHRHVISVLPVKYIPLSGCFLHKGIAVSHGDKSPVCLLTVCPAPGLLIGPLSIRAFGTAHIPALPGRGRCFDGIFVHLIHDPVEMSAVLRPGLTGCHTVHPLPGQFRIAGSVRLLFCLLLAFHLISVCPCGVFHASLPFPVRRVFPVLLPIIFLRVSAKYRRRMAVTECLVIVIPLFQSVRSMSVRVRLHRSHQTESVPHNRRMGQFLLVDLSLSAIFLIYLVLIIKALIQIKHRAFQRRSCLIVVLVQLYKIIRIHLLLMAVHLKMEFSCGPCQISLAGHTVVGAYGYIRQFHPYGPLMVFQRVNLPPCGMSSRALHTFPHLKRLTVALIRRAEPS